MPAHDQNVPESSSWPYRAEGPAVTAADDVTGRLEVLDLGDSIGDVDR